MPETKKKILIVTSTFPRTETDSIPRFVYDLGSALTETYEVMVLVPHGKGVPSEWQEGAMRVVSYRYAPEHLERFAYGSGVMNNLRREPWLFLLIPLFLLSQAWSIYRLSKKNSIDLINIHWPFPYALLPLFFKRALGVPIVGTFHGGDIGVLGKQGWATSLVRFLFRRFDGVTVVSTEIKRRLEALLPSLHITVIPMGIDTKFFSPSVAKREMKQGEELSILFVGRLSEKKGVHILIDALQKLEAEAFLFHCTIAGSGILLETLKEEVKAKKLTHRVTFPGFIQKRELPALLHRHDVFVGPSIIASDGDREGLPVAFMEAMAAGIPVIATNTPGIEDLIVDGENGLIVPMRDASALAASILRIRGDEGLRERLVKGGLASISEFDWEGVSRRFVRVFGEGGYERS